MEIPKKIISPLKIKEGTILNLNQRRCLTCGQIHPGHREVQLVKDMESGRKMVLKMNVDQEEVNLVERLSHPVIVSGFGAEDDEGHLMLLMDYIEGPDFYDYLASFAGDPLINILPRALEILIRVGEALIYLLGKNIQLGEFYSCHILVEKNTLDPFIIDFHYTLQVSSDTIPRYMEQLAELLKLTVGKVDIYSQSFSVIDTTSRKDGTPRELEKIISKCTGTSTPPYKDISSFVEDVKRVREEYP